MDKTLWIVMENVDNNDEYECHLSYDTCVGVFTSREKAIEIVQKLYQEAKNYKYCDSDGEELTLDVSDLDIYNRDDGTFRYRFDIGGKTIPANGYTHWYDISVVKLDEVVFDHIWEEF